MARELTGRHVLAITLAAFGVIIAVNMVMAVKAVSTFPGLETPNSYVASQEFDRDRQAARDYALARAVGMWLNGEGIAGVDMRGRWGLFARV